MTTFTRRRLWRVVFFLAAAHATLTSAACPARASTIPLAELGPYQTIRAVSAVIRQEDSQWPAPAGLFNGDGLSDRHPLRATHGGDLETVWRHAYSPVEPVAIEFDLGGEFLVNEMWIWQLPDDPFEDQGIVEFEVVMRGAAGQEVGVFRGDVTELKGVGWGRPRFNAFGECVFLPFDDYVRFIELRILRNEGDVDWVGLAEVLFAGRQKLTVVPEPAAGVLGIAAAVLLLGRHSRQFRS